MHILFKTAETAAKIDWLIDLFIYWLQLNIYETLSRTQIFIAISDVLNRLRIKLLHIEPPLGPSILDRLSLQLWLPCSSNQLS